ncbi:DUF6461 domain-containing protein [Micromonospora sp. WMMD998]|uniref:DUF6461 domain-containing protein n=1 Tax=Micromonospora sp. WMMD998 TaxID=3016092 RepID=UPI002499C05B|nr:DUF6461 domain-containing protein [Micromonospora sp. WMMD998]WFE41265.1 DUF6461 domain-containing protein [Micromonospora sp. WMMD998]
MPAPPDAVNDALAAFAAATMPVFAARVPVPPARLLGRLAAPAEADPHGAHRWPVRPHGDEPDWMAEMRALGPLPVERLLGALELAVAEHDWDGAPDLVGDLPPPPAGHYAWLTTGGGNDSAAASAATVLHALRPGLGGRVVATVRALVPHPAVAPLLAGTPAGPDEPSIAAAHGAVHLGLAVAVAGAVVHQADPPVIVERAAAVVGLAVGAAALVLREVPLPSTYAAALRERIRAEYLLPQHLTSTLHVDGHRFGLAEHGLPDEVDVTGNGLVAVVDGGVAVRTGVATGHVRVELVVRDGPPDEVESGWEEIVEVSWHAATGDTSWVPGDGGSSRLTPPWPGDYRVRVHARGRDDNDAQLEGYKLVVWSAPTAPEVVHRRSDQLGHRLRGEPEPVRPPEHAYRWIRSSPVSQAATVTVVTGVPVDQVVRAFGADPARPEPVDAVRRDLSLRGAAHTWIAAVLADDDAVVVVEDNGYRGSDGPVLCAASTGGRAASMFWNVNAVTRLSFAEDGRLLASSEPWGHDVYPPEVSTAVAGLDFAEAGDRVEKGLVAVERFTGRGLTAADLARIDTAADGYRITH